MDVAFGLNADDDFSSKTVIEINSESEEVLKSSTKGKQEEGFPNEAHKDVSKSPTVLTPYKARSSMEVDRIRDSSENKLAIDKPGFSPDAVLFQL